MSSLKTLESMFRQGANGLVVAVATLPPEYSTVTKEEAEEIATALMVLRSVREIEAHKREQVEKISEDVKNAYGIDDLMVKRLRDLSRDLVTLHEVQRRNPWETT
jgi:hypothetical protein